MMQLHTFKLHFVLLLSLVGLGFITACNAEEPASAPASKFIAGKHYHVISPAVATDVESGSVEVVELFWYGCPHCFEFEKYLKDWKQSKAENITFVQMPAVLNRSWETHARAFYALETMGEIERLHGTIFEAIHAQGRRLRDAGSIARFLGQHGIEEEEFKKAYNSFYVETKIKRAGQLIREYGVSAVPSVIINGKYRTTASDAGSYDKMLELIDYLAKQESES